MFVFVYLIKSSNTVKDTKVDSVSLRCIVSTDSYILFYYKDLKSVFPYKVRDESHLLKRSQTIRRNRSNDLPLFRRTPKITPLCWSISTSTHVLVPDDCLQDSSRIRQRLERDLTEWKEHSLSYKSIGSSNLESLLETTPYTNYCHIVWRSLGDGKSKRTVRVSLFFSS